VKHTPARVMGDVPIDYDGPIWYRLERVEYNGWKIPFSTPGKDGDALFGGDNAGSRIFTSGEIFSSDGKLLDR
jgi:hypothetical protein